MDACNCLFGSVHFLIQFPFESHFAEHVWHIVSASIWPGTFTLQQQVSPLVEYLSPVHRPVSNLGSRIAAHASWIIGEPETSGTSKMSNTADDTKTSIHYALVVAIYEKDVIKNFLRDSKLD